MPQIDLSKRRRIMQRSMKLGHCICDPRRVCPCEIFTTQEICPCAGERPDPVALEGIKLTEMVHNTGCASKIAPSDLEKLISHLPEVVDPAIVSGLPAGDDAGIYRLTDGVTLVQTVDVFTPCVDDPYMFGRICAANCLSDVYAMGGEPRTALSILGFPSETQDGEIMHLMLKGAMEVFAEANCSLIGGHSIKDEEIKLGFAITGTIDEEKAVALGTVRPGDMLVLTKPLGVGVLNFARQIGRGNGVGLAAAEASMATLNKAAAEAMTEVGVSACTDITGFGLFGHLVSMVRRSGVTAHVYADALPAFEGAVEALREGVIPGAIERNREYVGDDISVAEGVDEALVELGFDAQTSGGLLMSIDMQRQDRLLGALAARGVSSATIGRIVEESAGKIHVTSGERKKVAIGNKTWETDDMLDNESSEKKTHLPECCSDVFGKTEVTGTASESAKAFGEMIRAVGSQGALDTRTKELISFALVVMARCKPCIEAHLAKASKMGITRDELDEAVWLAVAMGGAPVWMFYKETATEDSAEGGKCCD